MKSNEVLDLFTQCGALLEGHFQLSSGLHSPGYLQCALVLQHPDFSERLGLAVAHRVKEWRPTVVLSPALGGILIGHEVARALGVPGIFVERREEQMSLRRGFQLSPGEQVLVVEDVITTGKSTQETIGVACDLGAEVIGVASVINRGGVDVNLGIRFETLAEVSWPTHKPTECPQCASGIPIMKPGSRPVL